MTQTFFVTQAQTGRPGRYVDRKTAVEDVNAILAGVYDEIPDEKFLYISNIKEGILDLQGVSPTVAKPGPSVVSPQSPPQVKTQTASTAMPVGKTQAKA